MRRTRNAPQTYYPRLRSEIWRSGDPWLYPDLPIPRSTRLTWLRRPPPDAIIGAELFHGHSADLHRDLERLQRRLAVLSALVPLLVTLLRVRGADLRGQRLPHGRDKLRILRAVERASVALPRAAVLRVLGLSSSRYHDWLNAAARTCKLDDRSSCPRRSPSRLTFAEISAIGQLLTDNALRHISIPALALHAQRIGAVFASAATWYKLAQRYRWLRPVQRVHCPPSEGLRATRPNQTWHIDTTLVRLLDGTVVHVQAVIDNFSRMVLAWSAATGYGGSRTVELLQHAATLLRYSEPPPTFLADAGSENINRAVDDLLLAGSLKRTIAQVQIRFSNSMIESLWRALKHRCLFLETLATVDHVRERVAFFFEQHNTVVPHAALQGRTPIEMYFGTGEHWPDTLAQRRAQARALRLEHNRAARCGLCTQPEPSQHLAAAAHPLESSDGRICDASSPQGP
jgi:putative transposase